MSGRKTRSKRKRRTAKQKLRYGKNAAASHQRLSGRTNQSKRNTPSSKPLEYP